MHLSEKTAENLLREISEVIDYDIYISDENGYIIASTNKARVNEYHIPSHKVVTEGLNELIVRKENEYPGCKVGINLPFTINGQIAGVIGITGPVEEVEGYGKIIKKITEILMQHIDAMQEQNTLDQNRMFFINSWLAGELSDEAYIEENIAFYGLTITSPMVVAVIKCKAGSAGVRQFLESRLTDPHVVWSLNSNDKNMGLVVMNAENSEACLEYYRSKFNDSFPEDSFKIALGDVHERYNHIQNSYQEAKKVLTVFRPKEYGIRDFGGSILEVAMHDISLEYKRKTVEKIFAECGENEKHDMADFIVEYYTQNGSITAISEDLFLHKNTVQYKIKKIKKKTGLDLRKAKGLTKLYFAAIWYLEFFN